MNDINYGGVFMGNCYLDCMFPKSETATEELLKRRDNPILQYVQQREMSDYVVFDRTKAMEIFLHSKEYKLLDYKFETEDPYWAKEDFKFEKYFVDKWKETKKKEGLCLKCKTELLTAPAELAGTEKPENIDRKQVVNSENIKNEEKKEEIVSQPNEAPKTSGESRFEEQLDNSQKTP